ncbi:MAG: hypothetical protein D6746_17535 [Bacteroidetes bacterium]|nr:MAG: hypothetical protein D6746_17535 [Bacteroidota bacterium]
MDKLTGIIAGFGVPGLILVVAMSATGFAGAAALTTALAALGGPFGMLGGIALLGLLVVISKALAEYGIEAVFKSVLAELKKKGKSKQDIILQVDGYPISDEMKRTLKEYIEKWG